MILNAHDPRSVVAAVAMAGWLAVTSACLLRARRSRYPSILWTCAGYMTLLHAVWLWGVFSSQLMSNGFGTIELLTFPWSMAVIFNMTMAGFRTLAGSASELCPVRAGVRRDAVPGLDAVCVGAAAEAARLAGPLRLVVPAQAELGRGTQIVRHAGKNRKTQHKDTYAGQINE